MSATAQATFAFGAGVATFFSPCVYALLPGYVGYYVANTDSEQAPLSGATARGVAASLGALGTFAVLSVLALLAGEILEQALPILEYAIGVLLIGLGLLIFQKGMFSVNIPLPARQEGIVGFAGFGAIYALAATACVLPLFLSVSVVSFDLPVTGTLFVLGSYAAGFALLMLAATVLIAVGKQAILDSVGGHAPLLTKIAGVIIIIAGFVQLGIAYGIEPSAVV